MRRGGWCWVAAAALAASAPVGVGHAKAPACQTAAQTLEKRDFRRAVALADEGLATDPEDLGCLYVRARAYHAWFDAKGIRFTEALGAYEALLPSLEDLEPADELQEARFRYGELLVKGGRYEAAIEPLKAFLKVVPEYPARAEVWNTLGVAQCYLDRYDEAVHAFKEALRIDPAYSTARFNMRSVFTRLSLFDVAMANRRAKRFDLALDVLDRLLGLAPRFGPGYVQKTLVLRELGRGAEAEMYAARALALAPGPKEAFALHDFLGDALAGRGLPGEALAEYRKCLRIFPGYIQVIEKIDAIEAKLRTAEPSEAESAQPAAEGATPAPAAAPVAEFPL